MLSSKVGCLCGRPQGRFYGRRLRHATVVIFDMAADRDANGKFVKGHKRVGNTGGKKKLPDGLYKLAAEAPDKLRALVDDQKTPAAVRANILQWAMEMAHGKPKQQADVDITADVAAAVQPLTLDQMRDLVLSLPLPDGGADGQ